MAVVAARQLRSPAFRRSTPVRRHRSRLAAVSASMIALLAGIALAGVIDLAWTAPAAAQGFTYNPPRPKPASRVMTGRPAAKRLQWRRSGLHRLNAGDLNWRAATTATTRPPGTARPKSR